MDDVEGAIQKLRSSFPTANIKVLKEIGDYSHVLTSLVGDLVLKIHLPKLYPRDGPITFVRKANKSYDPESPCSKIEAEIEPLKHLPFEDFLNECLKIQLSNAERNTEDKIHHSKLKKMRPKCHEKFSSDRYEKLPPMRTALDIINRIRWDSELDANLFCVGYLDRFIGIVEKAFDEFTWDKTSMVDDDPSVLAIPQHRIQFFKYKGMVVWDKNARIDLIFGSTGSSSTIFDGYFGDNDTAETNRFESNNFSPTQVEKELSEPIGAESSRPNFFACIKINSDILQNIANELHVYADSSLSEVLVPPSSLHCTLFTLHFKDTEEAKSIATGKDFQFSPFNLNYKGIEVLNDRILCVTCEGFLECFSLLRDSFGGYVHRKDTNRELLTHVTLAKFSNANSWGKTCLTTAHNQLQQKFKNSELGWEFVEAIYICSMKKDKRNLSGQFDYPIVHVLCSK